MKHLKTFENQNEWIEPENVVPGMIGQIPQTGKWYKILEIYPISFLVKNEKVYNAMCDKQTGRRVFDYDDIIELSKTEWLAVVEALDEKDKSTSLKYCSKPKIFNWTLHVPASENWKSSNKLIDNTIKTGVFENTSEENDNLTIDEIVPGMICQTENTSPTEYYEILEIRNVGEGRKDIEKFRNYLYNNSNWLRHRVDDTVTGYSLTNKDYIFKVKDDRAPKGVNIKVLGSKEQRTPKIIVPRSEAWKKYASDKLVQSMTKTGILENVENEGVSDDMIEIGMIGYIDIDVPFKVIKIYNCIDLYNNKAEFDELMTDDNLQYVWTNGDYEDMGDLGKENPNCKVFLVEDLDAELILTYNYKNADDGFHVPISEYLKKKSPKLKKANKKTGLFENVNDEYLQPNEITPGMIGEFSPYDGADDTDVEIVEIYKISELSTEKFKELQDYSDSKWLSYQFDHIENEHGPSDYGPDLAKPMLTVEDFIFLNSFQQLTKEDYLVKTIGQYDILGTEHARVTKNKMKEVLPYTKRYLQVRASQRWKGSDTLKTTNHRTGMFEHLKNWNNFNHE